MGLDFKSKKKKKSKKNNLRRLIFFFWSRNLSRKIVTWGKLLQSGSCRPQSPRFSLILFPMPAGVALSPPFPFNYFRVIYIPGLKKEKERSLVFPLSIPFFDVFVLNQSYTFS